MDIEEESITVDDTEIPISDFQNMSREDQKETMRRWFFENYEDPVERTPYESREGGYAYIWGGPYDAHDELSIFGDYVPDDLIGELAHELSMDCPEWTNSEKQSDYEDGYLDLILSDNEYFESFNDSISHIKEILEVNVDGATQIHLLGLLHVSVITAIETYLSDAFINVVLNNEHYFRRFVEYNPEFSKKSFKLSEIFNVHENIKNEVRGYLFSQLWHNIKKIKPMYKTTLDVDFKDDLESIFKAIDKRHDLVHRNGKNKEGEQVMISKRDLEELISEASEFVKYINDQLSEDDEEFDF